MFSELSQLKKTRDEYHKISQYCDDMDVYIELLSEEPDNRTIQQEVTQKLSIFKSAIDTLEIKSFLSGKYDKNNCYITIAAGAIGSRASARVSPSSNAGS